MVTLSFTFSFSIHIYNYLSGEMFIHVESSNWKYIVVGIVELSVWSLEGY